MCRRFAGYICSLFACVGECVFECACKHVWRQGRRVLWLAGVMPAAAERWAELHASSPISPPITEQSDRPDNAICCCISWISLFSLLSPSHPHHSSASSSSSPLSFCFIRSLVSSSSPLFRNHSHLHFIHYKQASPPSSPSWCLSAALDFPGISPSLVLN